jgi:hypothetical protein
MNGLSGGLLLQTSGTASPVRMRPPDSGAAGPDRLLVRSAGSRPGDRARRGAPVRPSPVIPCSRLKER